LPTHSTTEEITNVIPTDRKATFTNRNTNGTLHRNTANMMHVGLKSGTNTIIQSRGPSTAATGKCVK
jgi:hypothetical protein